MFVLAYNAFKLTLEVPRGGQFDPPWFFQIFSKTPKNSPEKIKVFLEASICNLLMVKSMLGVDPTQSYGKNTKSPIQGFHRFYYKNLLKINFLN